MHKVILDTSVVVGFLSSSNCSQIIKYLALQVELKKIELITSTQTFEELLEVIKKPYLKDRISPKTSQFIAWYKYNSKTYKIHTNIKQCRDPNDDKFLDLILASSTDFLITWDEDLLTLKKFDDCVICKPEFFWNVLDY
jgi:putative PIN family toxin of toxin-antitoxin system